MESREGRGVSFCRFDVFLGALKGAGDTVFLPAFVRNLACRGQPCNGSLLRERVRDAIGPDRGSAGKLFIIVIKYGILCFVRGASSDGLLFVLPKRKGWSREKMYY